MDLPDISPELILQAAEGVVFWNKEAEVDLEFDTSKIETPAYQGLQGATESVPPHSSRGVVPSSTTWDGTRIPTALKAWYASPLSSVRAINSLPLTVSRTALMRVTSLSTLE